MDNNIGAINPWDDYQDYTEQSVRTSVEEDIRMILLEERQVEEEIKK